MEMLEKYTFNIEWLFYYTHIIDAHLLNLLHQGINLPRISMQGFEHSHCIHKQVQRDSTSNESGYHKTPSSHQIMLRQLRLFEYHSIEDSYNLENNNY